MITYPLKRSFYLLGLTTVIVGLSAFPVTAETSTNTVVTSPQVTVPGANATTSSTDLQVDPNAPQNSTLTPQAPAPVVAQEIVPGTATRSGPSYIGVGGNIGFGGETTLSEGSFAVFSKIGLTNNLSARPAALLGDDQVFLIPLTVDFPVQSVTETTQQQLNVAPYLGAGAAISTGRDSTVGFLLTGGVDVPVSSQFTATAGLNVGFIDETEVGLLLGLGYNF
ncbi:MAG: hypothetical protein KME40_08370 [Komarekiella atlantica HA4396-MV6]|jgi:hypothetical protein|nr:hypothetical protein [Komarekiella atlantica HA4396-MV6]